MKLPRPQINPTSRYAAFAHTVLVILLPLIVLSLESTLFRDKLTAVACLAIFLSKWRMFSVRPRHWVANVRSNLVDITVGFAVVSFMNGTTNLAALITWTVLYSVWLLLIKPRSDATSMAIQALIAQGFGLAALFTNHNSWNVAFLVSLSWVICYSAARHFLTTFEDVANRPLSHIWGLFGAQMALILSHWQIVYGGFMPQASLVISLVGYALAVGYYLHKTRGLRSSVRNQLVIFTVTILLVIIVFSDWQYRGF